MALLSLELLINRVIELEGHVAKQVRGVREVLDLADKTIEILQAETKRLGEAVIEIEQQCSKLRRNIDENDARADRLEGMIARKHTEGWQHTDKAVYALAMDVGSVASDLADLRGELTG